MTKKFEFRGTPDEIGAGMFDQIIMPMIHQAAKKMGPDQLALVYCGLLCACCGSMAADFGKDAAAEIMTGTAESFVDLDLDEGMMQ